MKFKLIYTSDSVIIKLNCYERNKLLVFIDERRFIRCYRKCSEVAKREILCMAEVLALKEALSKAEDRYFNSLCERRFNV